MFAQQKYQANHCHYVGPCPTGANFSGVDPPHLMHISQWVAALLSSIQYWLLANAFTPPWLPRRWRSPLLGYLAAVLLQLLLTGCDLLLLIRYPDLTIPHLPLVLGVVIAALHWGVGPSLVATLTGALLLYSWILYTPFSWASATETDVAEFVLFLLICSAISALSGQAQRARLNEGQARRAAERLAVLLAQEHARSDLERQRLHAVLEVLPVGVCFINADGRAALRNQAERAIWGPALSEEREAYGTSYQGWWADTGQRLQPEDWPAARAVRQGQETRGEELIIQTGEGRQRTFFSAAVPIRDPSGAIVGAVAVLLDITERKQLEGALRQAEREQLVHEREEAEAQTQALREVNRRMDVFLGIVSHELKTPLTSIRLHLQLLHRRIGRLLSQNLVPAGRGTQELGRLLEQCRFADLQADRLHRLVNDLLDLSRIQAGKLEMRETHTDLRAIVRAAVDEQQELAPQRDIQLEVLAEQPLLVQVDAERIGQVVTNYLTNALKYSAENRSVRVGVQVEAEQARVWVQDEGPGIPQEEHAQLWERFHRVPGIEVQSGSGIGLGLGLHICQTIIERHGGQVGVESVPGAGSTFWFTLPLASQDEDRTASG
jgi:PAS domain S-box-containing protein